MTRKILKTPDDFMNHEPYKSIINAVKEAPSFHSNFKKGLRPRELRYIILKPWKSPDQKQKEKAIEPKPKEKKEDTIRYTIRDTSRPILDRFKVHLQNRDMATLNQSICGKNSAQGFNQYLKRLQHYGWITRKKGRILLSESYKDYPIRAWQKNFIMKCPVDHILTEHNATLFHPTIKYDAHDKEEIKATMNQVSKILNVTLRKTGLRKAGFEWSRFIKTVDCKRATKLYFWLKIIYAHYIASLQPLGIIDRDNYYFKDTEMPMISKETIMAMKSTKYDGLPESILVFYTKKSKGWQERFIRLLESAVKKKYSYLNKKEVQRHYTEFIKVCEETLHMRIDVEYFTLTIRPEFLSYFLLKDGPSINDKMAHNVSQAVEQISEYSDFFDDTSFDESESMIDNITDLFKDYEKEIKELGYKNKEELSYELKPLTNVFEMPD